MIRRHGANGQDGQHEPSLVRPAVNLRGNAYAELHLIAHDTVTFPGYGPCRDEIDQTALVGNMRLTVLRPARPTLALGAAAAWSLACALAGLLWAIHAAPYPFGPEMDAQSELSILGGIRRDMAAPAIAAFGVIGLLVVAVMWSGEPSTQARTALLAWGWGSVVVLAAVIPDYRLLVLVAYAPIFLVAAPLGLLPEGASLLDGMTPPVVAQAASMLGAAAWVIASRRYATWSTDPRASAVIGFDGARRWGRIAVAVAVIIPLLYALTRYAWALGIPLGVSEAFLREGDGTGMWVAGAALATIATLGAVLTVGLVARWGEVFPRWVPVLGGRRVPINLAVVPAMIVAALVTSAGLMFVRLVLLGGLEHFGPANWGAVAPELIWPIWGAALAVAALAYRRRRLGTEDPRGARRLRR